MHGIRAALTISAATMLLSACAGTGVYPDNGVQPVYSFPVTDNDTPYSQCLRSMQQIAANNLPTFSVGEVADKTGQINYDENGNALTQGVSEMVMSALFKTGKAHLVERFDLRVPLAEVRMAEQGMLPIGKQDFQIAPFDFLVLGALTELNYNIVSEGAGLYVSGIGAGARTVIINVALDMRVVDARTFAVRYVTSLQKQILGYEVEANVFRFFGDTLVEFDAGRIQNEPLQLGVRSVVEMGVHQIMTEFLGLPAGPNCALVETGYMDGVLEERNSDNGNT